MLITFKLVRNSLNFFMCFTVILLIYYYQNNSTTRSRQWYLVKTMQKFKQNTAQVPKETKILPDVKYILIWNKENTFDFLEKGQEAFFKNNCSYTNCYVSTHRNMLNNDYSNFHAIIFNGKSVAKVFVDGYMKLPKKRLSHQIYIFAMQDDAITYPVCAEQFDNYFNMTWTYKLNSDANWSLFKVLTLDTEAVVAPKVGVNWTTGHQDNNVFYDIQEHIFDKGLYGVWTSSTCQTQSRREDLVKQIKDASKKSGNLLHTVGQCGSRECGFAVPEECMTVYDNYNFYLAFEAVLTEDYVSSEILNAYEHYCVPVVYGAADYARFLPPDSYIDAGKLGANATANEMGHLMYNVATFFEYHEWRSSYKIVKNVGHAACDLCEALNKQGQNVYYEFRKWWNPEYKKMCRTKRKRYLFKRSIGSRTLKSGTVKP